MGGGVNTAKKDVARASAISLHLVIAVSISRMPGESE